MIKDSGNRREFETGAVRDMAEGKGRCDLMPLDIVSYILNNDPIILNIWRYQNTTEVEYLKRAVSLFSVKLTDEEFREPELMLEVSKHFEEGALKYGENNWQKGLPEYCYIDSAVRHYLKLMIGMDDERHDRAFVWNILCLMWTHRNITRKE